MENIKTLEIDALCDVGLARENNEDIVYVGGEYIRDAASKHIYELNENVRFGIIVADGIGGNNGGEIASRMAVEYFDAFLMSLPSKLDETKLINSLNEWVHDIHNIILAKGNENNDLNGMGTTFCGMLFYEKYVFVLSIGDSRLYRYRDGFLKQITTDHSLQVLMRDKSIPNNAIYNSLGAGEKAFVDIINISDTIFEGDIFIICSDGLHDMLDNAELKTLMQNNSSASAIYDKVKLKGALDNTSIVLAKVIKYNR